MNNNMAATKQHPAEIYAQQVHSGDILTCEFVQLAVDRYYCDMDNALDKGWYFDRKAAQRIPGDRPQPLRRDHAGIYQ